jgi:hypothetical protein
MSDDLYPLIAAFSESTWTAARTAREPLHKCFGSGINS